MERDMGENRAIVLSILIIAMLAAGGGLECRSYHVRHDQVKAEVAKACLQAGKAPLECEAAFGQF